MITENVLTQSSFGSDLASKSPIGDNLKIDKPNGFVESDDEKIFSSIKVEKSDLFITNVDHQKSPKMLIEETNVEQQVVSNHSQLPKRKRGRPPKVDKNGITKKQKISLENQKKTNKIKISKKKANTNEQISLSNTASNNVYQDASKKHRDPFLLVDCHQFSDDLEPPFSVKIKLDALALMDLHSHCVPNEIIGCLGGFYCRVTRTLHVLVAEPCISLDDHPTSCEMDPVSQAMALDKLEKQNFQMVGWYHSHPTFLPNPSLRDIDTQNYYQQIFTERLYNYKKYKSRNGNNLNSVPTKIDNDSNPSLTFNGTEIERLNDDSGGMDQNLEVENPFVAFIISPYVIPQAKTIKNVLTAKSFTRYEPIGDFPLNAKFLANNTRYDYHHKYEKSYCYFTNELNSVLASPMKCFWVGDAKYSKSPLPKQRGRLVPYEIEYKLTRDENFIPSITNRLSEMCQNLCRNQESIDLLKRFTRIGSVNVTYLEKIIASLTFHMQNQLTAHLCAEGECERVRNECVSILTRELLENKQRSKNKRSGFTN